MGLYDMYGLTHAQKYLDLMQRYGSPYLFGALLKGEDARTGRFIFFNHKKEQAVSERSTFV